MILEKIVKVKKHPSNYKWYGKKYKAREGFYVLPVEEAHRSVVQVSRTCDRCNQVQKISLKKIIEYREKRKGNATLSPWQDLCDTCVRSLWSSAQKGREGKPWSEESRAKAKISHTGIKQSRETQVKKAQSIRETVLDPEYRSQKKERYEKTKSLKAFTSKYGAEEGLKKYQHEVLSKCPRSIFYWLKREGSPGKAQDALARFQRRDEAYFIQKHGEIEGSKKYEEVLRKKVDAFGKGYSQISKIFFEALSLFPEFERHDLYFAENEWMIFLTKDERNNFKPCKVLYLDFFDRTTNFAIEFDGLYWHSKRDQKMRDELKTEIVRSRGIKLIRITDEEYLKDPEITIQKVRSAYASNS